MLKLLFNSKNRLRVGVVFIFLWWIPFWLIAPLIDSLNNSSSSSQSHDILVAILIVQTIIGILGVFIASRPVTEIVRHQPFRKVPKTIWKVFVKGTVDEPML